MLTFADSYDGVHITYGIDLNAHPVVNTATVAGLTWTHRPYGTLENNVAVTWETSHGGDRWWLFGNRKTLEDGERMWLLLTGAGGPRRIPGVASFQAAAIWAGRAICGPAPSDF